MDELEHTTPVPPVSPSHHHPELHELSWSIAELKRGQDTTQATLDQLIRRIDVLAEASVATVPAVEQGVETAVTPAETAVGETASPQINIEPPTPQHRFIRRGGRRVKRSA